MVKVLTSRHTYGGADRIDVAVKSSTGPGTCLVPTWPLVAGHKLQRALSQGDETEIERWRVSKLTGQPTTPLSDGQYSNAYLDLLRARYATDKEPFLALLRRDQITLTCYCAAGGFCHRHLAVNVLEKIALHHELPFERGGEIDPKTAARWLDAADPRFQRVEFAVRPIFEQPQRPASTAASAASAASVTSAAQADADVEASATLGTNLDQLSDALPASGSESVASDSDSRATALAEETSASGSTGEDGRLRSQRRTSPPRLLAYAALARVSNVRQLNAVVELGHFRGERMAEAFLSDLEEELKERGLPLSGAKEEVKRTESFLSQKSWQQALNGHWSLQTTAQNKAWQTGSYALERPLEEVKLDRDFQEVRFGLVPILTPNGWQVGMAAAALLSQGDKHALLELSHFANSAEPRANSYLDELEQDLQKRQISLAGTSLELERTTYALGWEARQSGLPSDWLALSEVQTRALENKKFVLEHPYSQVRLRSQDAWTKGLGLELEPDLELDV